MKTEITNSKGGCDISALYICGHDMVFVSNKNSIIIKNTDKYASLKQIWMIFLILPILCVMSLLCLAIILFISTILEQTALSILFLLIFIPCLFITCKMFMWVQALFLGFHLSLTGYQIKGRWGIIPIKRRICDDSEIILSLAHMRGAWGCRGKIKFSTKDFFSVSLFLPYVISSKKSKAIHELNMISNWLEDKISTIKIIKK